LKVLKDCEPSCQGTEFPVTVTGNNPQPHDFTLQQGIHPFQLVTLGPGSFTVHESVPPGFSTPIVDGACVPTPGSPEGTATISAGQTLTCNILNHPNG
jgi:hypothetical protein